MYEVFIDNELRRINVKDEQELLCHFQDHRYIRAAGGVVRHNEKYLFILRHDLWDIPKGKLEKDESVEAGAVREVEEECGVTGVEITSPLCETWHTYERKGKMHLKKSSWFLMTAKNVGSLQPQTSESITEVRFFTLEELELVRSNTYGSILQVITELKKR